MSWQVNYALANLQKIPGVTSAEFVRGDAIRITSSDQPDAVAVISASYSVNVELARQYHEEFPEMDFLCGYRKECIWEGDAIRYLEGNAIGWGSFGTLGSAVPNGTVNSAAHKDFFFSYRLINQIGSVTNVVREFDRVFTATLASGRILRVCMLMEYEPTADSVRTLWGRFGAVNIAWNINPNGYPNQSAIEAGQELGCEVMKWEQLRELLRCG